MSICEIYVMSSIIIIKTEKVSLIKQAKHRKEKRKFVVVIC